MPPPLQGGFSACSSIDCSARLFLYSIASPACLTASASPNCLKPSPQPALQFPSAWSVLISYRQWRTSQACDLRRSRAWAANGLRCHCAPASVPLWVGARRYAAKISVGAIKTKRLHLCNFQHARPPHPPPAAFSAAAGPNGCGKSSLLDAVLFAFAAPARSFGVTSLTELANSDSSEVGVTGCKDAGGQKPAGHSGSFAGCIADMPAVVLC